MNKINKTRSKKGFTLLEVMLAIAIMVMCAGVFFSLVLVVIKSHANVVAANDMADFAMLNARAFENCVINCKEINVKDTGSKLVWVNPKKNQLEKNSVALFNLSQYNVVPEGDKWKIEFKCKVSADGIIKYVFTLTDQASGGVEGINNYKYVYEGTVYVPRTVKIEATSGYIDKLYVIDY